MKSTKPYLLRAMYEWIVASDCTPHLLASATVEGVDVPDQAIKEGQVVLNVSPSAVRDLLMDDQGVSFVARFGGVSRSVYLPMNAIEGVYARENGRGMLFGEEFEVAEGATSGMDGRADTSDQDTSKKPQKKSSPALRVIK